MKKKLSAAINQAIRFYTDLCQSKPLQPHDRLPSLKEVSESTGVSLVTCLKAARYLQSKGVVVIRPGKGIFVADPRKAMPSENPATASAAHCAWQRCRDAMLADIYAEAYGSDMPLPSINELARTYGVHHQTARKALQALIDERAIVKQRRSYRVRGLPKRQNRSTIALIVPSMSGYGMFRPQRHQQFALAMEQACLKHGLLLEGFGYDADENGAVLLNRNNVPASEQMLEEIPLLLGCIVLCWNEVAPMSDFMQRLLGMRKPVAICDEAGNQSLISSPPGDRLFTRFVTAYTSVCGVRVARYLLGKGHRRVAYMSPYHASRWSRNRLAGIQAEYARGGCEGGVVPFTLQGFANYYEFGRDEDNASFARQIGGIADQIHQRLPNCSAPLQKYLGGIYEELLNLKTLESQRQFESPLFEQALRDAAVTAWVAANDMVAIHALDYLGAVKADVPGRIALIGFDNSVEAFQNKLTSYDFDMAGLARHMLAFVLDPHNRTLRNRPAALHELDGFVQERVTA
jgi:DNA-binding transcriptional regulator YhcF (GntR family)